MEATDETEVHVTYSSSKKGTDFLDDLLGIIKSITEGMASVSFKTIENILECNIKVSAHLPCVTVFYNKSLKNITEKDLNVINGKGLQRNFIVYKENNINLKTVVETNSLKKNRISKLVERKNVERRIKIEHILHDLLVIIEIIIIGRAFISSMIEENVSIYKVNSTDCQHGLILSYENHFKDPTQTFTVKSNKRSQEKIHTNENPHVCTFCVKGFRTNKKKQRHERTHLGEKPYACTFCDKHFSTKTKIKLHERIHTGEKPCACAYCNKTFSNNAQKNLHERIHTGERPYPCAYCDKTFRTSSDKLKHQRIHTGEKPYACAYCDKRFIVSGSKVKHERIHTGERPYDCTYCDKIFRTISEKHYHERSHTGENPHACTYCDKTFRTNAQKQMHERRHTGERPYACSYCDKTFITNSSKRKHVFRTHYRESTKQNSNLKELT